MKNLILSAFSDEYADSAEEQARALATLGISYTEVRHLDGKNVSVMNEDEVRAAKEVFDRNHIRVSAIGSPIGKIALDGDLRAHFEMAERVFSYARLFGARFVRIFSFYAPVGKNISDMKNEVLFALGELIGLARRYGITLCHENEAGIYGDAPKRVHELLYHFGGELKCVFDMGNFVLEGVDPYPNAYEMLRDYIAYFHIKDALFEGAIVPPGKGEAKIQKILSAHKTYAKEDFFVSLEPHLQTFSGLNALVGRNFKNPYQYPDQKTAFVDALNKFKELM